ncbi:ATP-binding protein [Streptomyces sp. MST-110588]|uniref:ATP-binding protein n=1 Tax=Streptomyces sp. MST-110588 TaxID=2833628 RepID=UPI001F5D7D21|nr:ATP-binding protein [Streptomyces sp. MST-110588]UNO40487.1 ATP-binding protein [Streptomyces sp. MST-110588]
MGSTANEFPEEFFLESSFAALFTAVDPPRLRARIGEYAARWGLSGRRRGGLLLSVNEVVDNAIRHAGGGGHLRLYQEDGLVRCRVSDHGPGFDASVIPSCAPPLDSTSGWGLWTAQRLTDGLEITSCAEGAVVTLSVLLP